MTLPTTKSRKRAARSITASTSRPIIVNFSAISAAEASVVRLLQPGQRDFTPRIADPPCRPPPSRSGRGGGGGRGGYDPVTWVTVSGPATWVTGHHGRQGDLPMPWKETCLMDERVMSIAECLRGELPMTALWSGMGSAARPTKWLGQPPTRSVAPRRPRAPLAGAWSAGCHGRGEGLRLRHPHWGPKKFERSADRGPMAWPAASTIGDLLRREELPPATGDARGARVWDGATRFGLGWFARTDSAGSLRSRRKVSPDYRVGGVDGVEGLDFRDALVLAVHWVKLAC